MDLYLLLYLLFYLILTIYSLYLAIVIPYTIFIYLLLYIYIYIKYRYRFSSVFWAPLSSVPATISPMKNAVNTASKTFQTCRASGAKGHPTGKTGEHRGKHGYIYIYVFIYIYIYQWLELTGVNHITIIFWISNSIFCIMMIFQKRTMARIN